MISVRYSLTTTDSDDGKLEKKLAKNLNGKTNFWKYKMSYNNFNLNLKEVIFNPTESVNN